MTDGLLRGALIIAGIVWMLGAACWAAMTLAADNDSQHSKWLARLPKPLPDVLAILEGLLWPLALLVIVVALVVVCVVGLLSDLVRGRT